MYGMSKRGFEYCSLFYTSETIDNQYQYSLWNSMKRNLSSTFTPNNNPSSFAHKYGISTKENNPLDSLGLNPNLNIEDQYIENLLKQIHFMNMEIKLIKEKQSQSNGNALWGIINRTNQPMVSNIVQSSQKYHMMKKECDGHLHKLEKDITALDNNQGALLNEIKFLEKKKEEILQKNKKWVDQCQEKHKALDEKIENHTKKLKNTSDNLEKEKKLNKQLTDSLNKSTNQDKLERSKQEKESLQIMNDQSIEERISGELTGQISLIKVMIAALIKSFEENKEYILAQEEEKALKQRVIKFEQAILKQNFEINQSIESIKMAELQKDKEIRERKILTQDYEKKKVMLAQMVKLNAERKQKQIAVRKKESPQILKAEEQTIKLEKSLEDIRKKLLKNQEVNHLASHEILQLQNEILKLKDKKMKLEQDIGKQADSNSKLQTQKLILNGQIVLVVNDYEKTLQTETSSCFQLLEVERQLQYLRERRDLLMKNIQLRDVINGLKIEDLEKVVQKNKDLNSTVASLMTKWDEIKDFSRM